MTEFDALFFKKKEYEGKFVYWGIIPVMKLVISGGSI
jgi:hypothetical protein